MSTGRDLLILQVFTDELRLVPVAVSPDFVEIGSPRSFKSNQKNTEATALSDQLTVDQLSSHVRERQWVGRELVCMVSGSSVACQSFDMPQMANGALRQAVMLKLGQQLHFPVGEAVVAMRTVGYSVEGENKNLRIQATAVHRDLATAATRAAEMCGLYLVSICAGPDVLAACTERLRRNDSSVQAVLHIDERIGTLVIHGSHSVSVATELPVAAGDLTAALMRPIISGEEVIQLDVARALKLRAEIGIPGAEETIASLNVTGDRLLPLLEPPLQKIVKQLTQWITFSTTCAGGGAVQSIRLVGPGASIRGLAEAIGARINIPVQHECGTRAFIGLADEGPGDAPETFALNAAAALDWASIPNAIPTEILRERTLRRVRRSIALCGPAVAAALLFVAFLFSRVDPHLQARVQSQQAALADMQRLVEERQKWTALQASEKSLQRGFDEFALATPHWVGVFKEMSLLLPREVQATEYVARDEGHGLTLTVSAKVYALAEPGSGDRSFDEVATQTLLMLQRSSFFERVEIVSANQAQSSEDPGTIGTISLRLDLAYPREKAKA
jgi:Tfp pilus assembly PilM family ATPase